MGKIKSPLKKVGVEEGKGNSKPTARIFGLLSLLYNFTGRKTNLSGNTNL